MTDGNLSNRLAKKIKYLFYHFHVWSFRYVVRDLRNFCPLLLVTLHIAHQLIQLELCFTLLVNFSLLFSLLVITE
jgi:hypothetical protein